MTAYIAPASNGLKCRWRLKKATVVSSNVWKTLRCSFCGYALGEASAGAECQACGFAYPYAPGGALDLRLKQPKTYDFPFELGTPLQADIAIEPLTAKSDPEVDFGGMGVPYHMTRELMSYFPRARSPGGLMLDLGCGDAVHRPLCERAGYEWVGIDYDDASKASILADAHALPFQDDTFECILTVAVFHLIRFPFVAMREACRVLKPHGTILGTVAFLEPYHPQTYYNHSHLGTLNTLRSAGLTVHKLAPSEEWTGLEAQASMGLFPRMPRFMIRSVVFPVDLLHRLWWQMGRTVMGNPGASNANRIRNNTGGFAFVASKGGA